MTGDDRYRSPERGDESVGESSFIVGQKLRT